ncbi:MAG: signal peptidase I [Reinekea sp.]
MIWQTISQGFDFALLMIGATVFTGVIWVVDRIVTYQYRQAILNRAEAEVSQFDEKTSKTALEPGLIENSRAFFPILIIVFVLRSFIVEPFQIPSGSMKPTLEIHDFILVNRFSYGLRMPVTNKIVIPVSDPKRGDVIVFKPPHKPEVNFIKRVVAVPGDRIQYDYDRRILRINGEVIEKEYVGPASDEKGRYRQYTEDLLGREHSIYNDVNYTYIRPYAWLPKEGVVVPEGKYFVMGDNRDNSQDARFWEGIRQYENRPGELYSWGFVDEDAILGKAFAIWMHWDHFHPSFSRAGGIQ